MLTRWLIINHQNRLYEGFGPVIRAVNVLDELVKFLEMSAVHFSDVNDINGNHVFLELLRQGDQRLRAFSDRTGEGENQRISH